MTALAVLGVACVHADFDPVPLKPESFTVDVIVEATAPPPLGAYTTATMDGGTNNNSNVWFEQGYLPGHWGLLGLPAAGSEFTAQDDPNRTYKMAPSYSDDNALFLSLNGSPSGTLTVVNPKAGMVLSVIGSVAGGATTIEYVVYHQDGSSTAGEVEVPDWFNVNVNRAVTTGGRINVVNGRCDQLAANNPHLYYVDIPLLNNTSPVTKVDFTTTRDSNMALFGLSISSDYATFTPLDVTGFNRDMVVEAGAPSRAVFSTNATSSWTMARRISRGTHGMRSASTKRRRPRGCRRPAPTFPGGPHCIPSPCRPVTPSTTVCTWAPMRGTPAAR